MPWRAVPECDCWTRAPPSSSSWIRLDTRLDLVEAIALYRRHGFVEIAPYHDDKYAEIFFEKRPAGEPWADQGLSHPDPSDRP
ncbi:hypothetical protein ACTPOK_30455 [Streptomyces inhibens]|uniref:hypothetical protein n=1 Tax=Streptomyces inhibens TaxID=2293571 RepID=UPI00402A9D05